MIKQKWFLLFILLLLAIPLPLWGDKLNFQNREIDQRHLKLELFFDLEGQAVIGLATLQFSLVRPSQYIRLHGEKLTIYSVVNKKGKALPFDYDGKILTIFLSSHQLRAGRGRQVTISYKATPRKGLYFFKPTKGAPNIPYQVWSQGEGEDNHRWFPCYDKPDDRLTSEIIAYVPQKFTVISNGVLLEKKNLPWKDIRKALSHLPSRKKFQKFTRWHFTQKRPHVTYLISVIVGKFARIQGKYKKIPLSYYVPREWEKWASYSFGLTPKMMAFFEKYTGQAYPWPKYDQTTVWDFTYGGMENTGATTLNMRTLHDKRAHLDYRSDYLVAHEMAHQWFGDLVTSKEWSHIWLNEGFATYFTQLWVEHHEGRDEFILSMRSNNRGYMRGTAKEKWSRFKRKEHTPIDLAFAGRAYTRGAAVLNMLRFVVGDGPFKKGIRLYLRRHHDRGVVSEDFRRAMEDASGRDLSWFFYQWVYGAGFPEFTVQYNWNPTKSQAEFTIEQTHKTSAIRGVFQLPVLLECKGVGYTLSRRVLLTKKRHSFSFKLPSPPRIVRFNKNGWICCQVKFAKSLVLWKHQALKDDDPAGRISAVEQLATFQDKALPILKQVFAKEKLEEIRKACLASLVKIGAGKPSSSKVVSILIRALKDPKSSVRRKAVALLAGFPKDKKKTTPLLMALFHSDPSYYVRAEVCKTLGKIKAKQAQRLLYTALNTKSFRNMIQEYACYGLSAMANPKAISRLYKITKYSQGLGGLHGNRQAALGAMVKLAPHHKLTEKAILEALEDPYYRMRAKAAQLAGQLSLRKAIPLLKKLQKDLHWQPRGAAKRGLEKITKAPNGVIVRPLPSRKQLKKQLDQYQKQLGKTRIERKKMVLESQICQKKQEKITLLQSLRKMKTRDKKGSIKQWKLKVALQKVEEVLLMLKIEKQKLILQGVKK